jgi:hypothetical protein
MQLQQRLLRSLLQWLVLQQVSQAGASSSYSGGLLWRLLL